MSCDQIKLKRRKQLIRIYGETCLKCGVEENLSIDHVLPKSLGGRWSLENLQLLCRTCNEKKGNKNEDYRPDNYLQMIKLDRKIQSQR